MSGRVIRVLTIALAVTALPLMAQPRDGDRRDRGDRDRPGDKKGRADKAPPDDRGPGKGPGGSGKGPGGRGPGGMGRGKGPGSRPGGGEGYGRGGMHKGHRPVSLTKEQEAELLKHLEKYRPELSKRIGELRGRDERMYRHTLSRMWRYYKRLKDLPESLRKRIYAKEAARRKTYRLLKALKDVATSAEKAKLTAELRETVTVQFEAEQAEREYRLTQLAKEIERVRAELKARLAQRNEIITHRVESLLKMTTRLGSRGPGPRDGRDRPPPKRPED